MPKSSTATVFVALLRGVNVGGNNIISMSSLRTSFEKMGFSNVSTYINSGNVIFQDPRKSIPELVRRIEAGINSHCKMDVRVIVKSKSEMAAICRKLPADWVTDKVADLVIDVVRKWDAAGL